MRVLIRYHDDVDGFLASRMAKKLVKYEFPSAKIVFRFGKTPKEDEIRRMGLEKWDLIVFIDTGSEAGEHINKYLRSKQVWIFDHHRRFDHEYPEVDVYVNPTERRKDSVKYATASTILLDELIKRHIATRWDGFYALVGAAADIADIDGKWYGLNRKALDFASKGKNIEKERTIIARYKWAVTLADAVGATYYPVPNQKALEVFGDELSVNWYELNEEKKREVLDVLSLIYLEDEQYGQRLTLVNKRIPFVGIQEVHEFAAFLDGVSNKLDAVHNPEKYIGEARKRIIALVRKLSKPLPDVARVDLGPVNVAIASEWVPSYVVTLLATRKYTEKPLILLSKYNGKWYITAREHPKHDLDLGKLVYRATRGIGYGGGHLFAGGGGLTTGTPVEFVENLKKELNV